MGQKILVVEDNELNLRLFCDLLRVHGYEAEPVRDGREAVDRARAFNPDLIVMDIQMPHISGLELIDQLKADAELKAIPVMAVTAMIGIALSSSSPFSCSISSSPLICGIWMSMMTKSGWNDRARSTASRPSRTGSGS